MFVILLDKKKYPIIFNILKLNVTMTHYIVITIRPYPSPVIVVIRKLLHFNILLWKHDHWPIKARIDLFFLES